MLHLHPHPKPSGQLAAQLEPLPKIEQVPRSDRGRTWSAKQLLRVIKMDGVDVDRHPCARKQVRIVRFARREHGWARGGRRCE